MKVEFLKQFYKDIDDLKIHSVKLQLIKVIEHFETEENLQSIPNIKKLKGHKFAYRVRIGDYRIGFFYQNDIVQFARVIHRKDIYRLFP
jgi:mRNA interferase RelE/StbE